MEELKYNILWLDDYFGQLPENAEGYIKKALKTFNRDVDDAIEYGFKVKGVDTFEAFAEEMRNIDRYDAIILDLRGMTKDGQESDSIIMYARELIRENKQVLTYIYSANLDDESKIFSLPLEDLRNAGHVFGKGESISIMYERIKQDLDSSLRFYVGYEYCLNLFTENYLSSENRGIMDEILIHYNTLDDTYQPYNGMRQILEDLCNELVSVGVIPKNIYFKDDELKTLNQRIDYLAKFYHTHNDKNKNGKPIFEYDNPIVPFSVCSREIKYIFNFLKDITNKYSHFLKENPNYLGPGESAHQYNRLVKQSCYPAFFVVMKWYYNYMSKNFHKE